MLSYPQLGQNNLPVHSYLGDANIMPSPMVINHLSQRHLMQTQQNQSSPTFPDADTYFDDSFFNFPPFSPFDSPLPIIPRGYGETQSHPLSTMQQPQFSRPQPSMLPPAVPQSQTQVPVQTQSQPQHQQPPQMLRPSDIDQFFDNNGIYDLFADSRPPSYYPPSEMPLDTSLSFAPTPRISPFPAPFPPQFPAATKRPISSSMTTSYSFHYTSRPQYSSQNNTPFYQPRTTIASSNSTYFNASSPTSYLPPMNQSNVVNSMNGPMVPTDPLDWFSPLQPESVEEWSDDGSASGYDASSYVDPPTRSSSPPREKTHNSVERKRKHTNRESKEFKEPKKEHKRIKQESSSSEPLQSSFSMTSVLLKSYPSDSLNVVVVGTYTRAERAARIARYRMKRSQRKWEKKILYNCRKSFADRRPRVGGRFVKMS